MADETGRGQVSGREPGRGSEPPDLAEVLLSPYLAEQLADLDPLRDETGDVPYPADG